MPRAMFEDVIRFLRHTCAIGADCDLTDAQLLDRFLSQREETAFTFLVQRHGPMILGVGRRVLGDAHEAEDVLQATFLILARRTRAIGGKRSIGGWLHGVAHHVALKAKATSAARRKRESEVRTMPSARPVDELTCQELRAALDEAIASLPEKYHAPVVLCYLEDKSYEQAAQELGCPKTTLARRLTQAREVLRKKLVRRGIGLTAAALATALVDVAAAAPMPAMLTIKTVKAAGLVVAGKSVVGCLSAGAIALAEEAMMGMIVAKGKLVLLAMVVGLVVGGVGWAGIGALGEKGQPVLHEIAQRTTAKKDAGADPSKKPKMMVDHLGDPLPNGAVVRFGTKRLRHGRYVWSVAFSPDGKELASCSEDGFIRFWDTSTGSELRRFPQQLDAAEYVAYLAGGKELLVGEENRGRRANSDGFFGIRIWDVMSGKPLRTLTDKSPDGLTLSARKDRIAFIAHNSVSVINLRLSDHAWLPNGSFNIEVENARDLTNLDFSPDGTRIAVGGVVQVEGQVDWKKRPSFVKVYDLVGRKFLWERRGITRNAAGVFPAAQFSPDGKVIAMSFSHVDQMVLVDSVTGKLMRQFSSPTVAHSPFRFSLDGTKLYTTGWGEISDIFDVKTGRPVGFLPRGGLVFDLKMSPNGKVMASAESRKIRLLKTDTGEPAILDGGTFDDVDHIAVLPDGQRLLAGGQWNAAGGFAVLDRKTSRRLFEYPKGVWTLSLAPDGETVAVIADRSLVLFDLKTRKMVKEGANKDNTVWRIVYSPDGKRMFSMGYFGSKIAEIDRNTMISRPLLELPNGIGVDALAVFPTGEKIAVASATQSVDTESFIEIWELAGKRKVRSLLGLKGGVPLRVAVSRDGRRVAAASANNRYIAGGKVYDTRVLVWDADTGEQIAALPGGINGHRCVTFSPDGRTVAAGGEDNTAYVWEVASGTVRARFTGHEGPVTAVAFTPDSRTLYTGSSDTTILAWDLMAPATESSDVSAAWASLTDRDGVKGHRAMRTLISTPASTIAMLALQLKKLPSPDEASIKKLIVDLDSPAFATREIASKELMKMGRVCIPLLRDAARTKSLEISLRANKLIRALEPHRLTGDELQQVRAVEVLECIATPDARRLLAKLASGAYGHLLTEEAKTALERLAKR